MAYDQFHKIDTTSQMIEVALRSTSTGQLLTGVAYSAVAAKYLREGAASQTTVSVVAGTQGTFVSGGWVETGIAGVYQFGIPDAALASGSKAVTLVFSTSGAIDVVKRVVLVVEDLRDVLVSSRLAPATAGRTLDVDASGNAAANVTYWAGVAVAAADADGMIKVDAEKWTGLFLDEFAPPVTAFMDSGNTITSQRIRDAMKLAPTAGAPAAGSVDAHLDDILTTIGSEIVEGTYTRDDILRIIAAALAGETSGSGTSTVTITGLDGVTTRITATLDGGGNRTAMTLDGEV